MGEHVDVTQTARTEAMFVKRWPEDGYQSMEQLCACVEGTDEEISR